MNDMWQKLQKSLETTFKVPVGYMTHWVLVFEADVSLVLFEGQKI